MADLSDILRQTWGYDSFRPLQREAMDCVMEGRDSLVVLPTGGGKSLCYQAPALALPGTAVVVSPLISLMKDQVDALRACGVRASCLNSSTDPGEKRSVGRGLREGTLDLLYVSPERLAVESFVDYLSEMSVSFFAIDEAHCISHWGHDFRPEYRELSRLRERFPAASFHAFTATATARVRDDIATQLGLSEPVRLVGSFFRPNLKYTVEPLRDRLARIRRIIDRHPGESGIIYSNSRRNAEKLADQLSDLGYRALPYHAGLDPDARRSHQDAFVHDDCDIMVATVAFGMGIDKSNVRFVIHAGMPKTIEHYVQESGRAGRDGLPSECALLYSPGDHMSWRSLMGDLAETQRRGAIARLEEILAFCRASICRHAFIVRHFGQGFDRDACDACDVCLNEKAPDPPVSRSRKRTASAPRPLPDALVVAQKILSCVVRLGESASADSVVRVLRGAPSGELDDPAHAELSTWGLLRDRSKVELENWLSQLLARACLRSAPGHPPVLDVTAEGWRALRGQAAPRLFAPSPSGMRSAGGAAPRDDTPEEGSEALFEALRIMRKRIADEKGVPAYVIFHDATLREITRARPRNTDALLDVPGIGERKAQAFGAAVLEVVSEHLADAAAQ